MISKIKPTAWARVGKILGFSGTKGLVKIKSFCEKPEDIEKYMPLCIEGRSIKFNIRIIESKNEILKVSMDNINSVDEAKSITGSFLLAHRKTFPKTDSNEYYYSDLIGSEVFGKFGEALGTVINVSDYGAGAFLEVQLKNFSKSQLVPFNSKFVLSVNTKEKVITVDLFSM